MFSSLEKRGFKFGRKIGQGSSSVVLKAIITDRNGTVLELACKIVDKKKSSSEFLIKFFPRELELMKKIKHPNIIGIHGILESKNIVFIFQQFAEKGNLLDKIISLNNVEENLARTWSRQIVAGINYLHSISYAHRDLKCENILISRHNNVKVNFSLNCCKIFLVSFFDDFRSATLVTWEMLWWTTRTWKFYLEHFVDQNVKRS